MVTGATRLNPAAPWRRILRLAAIKSLNKSLRNRTLHLEAPSRRSIHSSIRRLRRMRFRSMAVPHLLRWAQTICRHRGFPRVRKVVGLLTKSKITTCTPRDNSSCSQARRPWTDSRTSTRSYTITNLPKVSATSSKPRTASLSLMPISSEAQVLRTQSHQKLRIITIRRAVCSDMGGRSTPSRA